MKRYTRRPLPPYRHLPGVTPHPERDPDGHMYEKSEPPARPLAAKGFGDNGDHLYAVDLFNAGYFWEAHATWERLWALAGTGKPVKRFLQGLIQLAAACLKRSQGELDGARKLLARSRENLGAPSGSSFGVDVVALARDARAFVEGAGVAPTIELRLRE